MHVVLLLSFKCRLIVISVKNAFIDPVTLLPKNHVIFTISQAKSVYQIWTLWGHLFLSYAPDKQTAEYPTHADQQSQCRWLLYNSIQLIVVWKQQLLLFDCLIFSILHF